MNDNNIRNIVNKLDFIVAINESTSKKANIENLKSEENRIQDMIKSLEESLENIRTQIADQNGPVSQRICKNCGKPEFGLFGHWTKTGGYKCDQYDDTGKKLKNTRKSL